MIRDYLGYWAMDEFSGSLLHDASGNGNDGTATGTTIVDGKISKARSFVAASSDYINVPDANLLDITGQFSISAWMTRNSYPASGGWAYVMAKGYTATGEKEPYAVRIFNEAGTPKLEVLTYDNSVLKRASWTISGWNTGDWHHVVGVYDGANLIVYFDNVSKATLASTQNPTASATPLTIGSWNNDGTAGRFWDGLLDDVRLYNRGLPSADVAELYSFPPKLFSAYSVPRISPYRVVAY